MFEPWKMRGASEHGEKFGLAADEVQKTELAALRLLREQDGARVDALEVLAVPIAVIVALAGVRGAVPTGEAIVEQQVQLEVDVGAVPGNDLARVGGAAHHGNRFAGPNGLTDLQMRINSPQVRVKRIEFQAFDLMAQHDIIAVIRQAGARVDIGHGAVGSGQDRIDRLAAAVALQAADVPALVKFPAPRADAAPRAAVPALARGPRKEFSLPPLTPQRAV